MRKTKLSSGFPLALAVFAAALTPLRAQTDAASPMPPAAPSQESQPAPASVAVGITSTSLPDAPAPAAPVVVAAPAGTSAPTPVQNPYKRFLDSPVAVHLTPEQKARLAFRNLTNVFNFVTIVGTAGYTIGSNAHTAYGPAWAGFGKDIGYSYLQDATGEFFGTFLIPSLTHEDPHYHRWPKRSIPRRVFHAIDQTFVTQNDQGRRIPNYAVIFTNPICAEISNLYVPGVADDAASTAARVMVSYATDPVDNLITEFLPSIASHIHVRVIFVQQIINKVSATPADLP